MSRMCTVLWPCTPCVGLGMCVHMGVELYVYCCMGVNCGLVFMPVGLGSVYLVSMQPPVTGRPVCVRLVRAAFRRRPEAAMCTGRGSSAVSHGCPMQALETQVPVQVSSVPDLLCDLKPSCFPLWNSFSLLYTDFSL